MDAVEVRELYQACLAPGLRERELAFQRLGRLLYPIAWRQVKDDSHLQHLAEDCTQEALVIIWQRLGKGRGPDRPDRFVSWCAAIVVNKVREEVRRLNPTPAVRRAKRVGLGQLVSLDAPATEERPALAETAARDAPSADDAVAYAAIRDLVREIRTIPEISEQSRTVLLKGFIEGWDDADLAELLGTTRANVHVIRCRDLAKIREVPAFMDRLRAWYG